MWEAVTMDQLMNVVIILGVLVVVFIWINHYQERKKEKEVKKTEVEKPGEKEKIEKSPDVLEVFEPIEDFKKQNLVNMTTNVVSIFKKRDETFKNEMDKNHREVKEELEAVRATKKEIYELAQTLSKIYNQDLTKKEMVLASTLNSFEQIEGSKEIQKEIEPPK